MPLNVSYKNRIGYYTYTTKPKDGPEQKYKIWFCHCNAMVAEIYFYTNDKGVKMAQLHGFFADIGHFKRCMKDNFYENCDNFHFKAEEMSSDIWKMVKELANAGRKVTIN